MTDHHDEMRVAPDPSQAEELQRRLHARLAAADGDEPIAPIQDALVYRPSVDADPDDREGDLVMLETEDRPTGDEPGVRRRWSSNTRRMVAATAAVVALVATVLVAGGSDDEQQIKTGSPTPTTAVLAPDVKPSPDVTTTLPFRPEQRFVDPDGDDATPLRVAFQVPNAAWYHWFGATKYVEDADGFTGLSITTVSNLVTDGCRDHAPLDPPVGPTVDDLAIALSQLAPFEVTAPPTDVTVQGHKGKHLKLTVPALKVTGAGEASGSMNDAHFTGCVDGELYSWISPINDSSPALLAHSPDSRGAFNAYQAPGQTEEFWILDVEGTRLVIVSFDSPQSPPTDIAERNAIFDSIRIEP